MSYGEALKELKNNVGDDVKKLNPAVFGDGRAAHSTQSQPLGDDIKIEAKTGEERRAAKPSKYHNQRTKYNGIIFDSKKEAIKAQELDLRVKAGDIDFWLYHVRFPLPGNVVYESDFMTFKPLAYGAMPSDWPHIWKIEVQEVKMYRKATKKHKEGYFFTPDAKLKMKLFKATYPNIKVVVI